MIFDKAKLFGMIMAGSMCAGIGATQAATRGVCETASAAPLCQPDKGSRSATASSGKFRVAQIMPFDCVDRCIADFKTCMGGPKPSGPPVTLPPPGSNNTVPTPPPYEFCIGVQDQCIAACKAAAGGNTR